MASEASSRRLTRSLGLGHVFVISTGAMVSSGLFLLPSLAVEEAGPAAVLAYFLAGLLAIPAMLSVAELSTAMPRAGGSYYFLARALGPAGGTVTGMATWLSLVMKDAFALVGMSAYLAILVDLPGTPTAVALIAVFTALNIVGAKSSAIVQLGLVAFVLSVMTLFLGFGLPEVGSGDGDLEPFFGQGSGSVLGAVSLVFVSYGGLTKVASVAEEIEDPSRNIPLGMALSLGVSTLLYTLGVLVVVATIPASELVDDLVPIHTAAEAVMPAVGAGLVVAAALAAFASAANAGILAAARYPMAMSRDGLMDPAFQNVGRFGTPVRGVLLTGVGMAIVVIAFDTGAIAKLASAFVLLTLALVNLAVIVLRSARIASYAPGFRAPWFPYLQLFGLGFTIYLIFGLGWVPVLLVCISVAAALVWFYRFGQVRSNQTAGAIHHIFERLGRSADRSIDREISAAMQSHGLRAEDDYAGLIARAAVISVPGDDDITEAATRAAQVLGNRIGIEPEQVNDQFLETGSLWIQPSETHPTATPVAFFEAADDDHLVIAASEHGIVIPEEWGGRGERVNALFFLAGTAEQPGRALRLAGELAAYLHTDDAAVIAEAAFEAEVKQALLPTLEIGQYPLLSETEMGALIGRSVAELDLGPELHAEAVHRGGKVLRADPDLVLEPDDQLTIIGPEGELPVGHELVARLTR
ncbi:MAG: amino acid permease [Acidimicrobiales bacterium]